MNQTNPPEFPHPTLDPDTADVINTELAWGMRRAAEAFASLLPAVERASHEMAALVRGEEPKERPVH